MTKAEAALELAFIARRDYRYNADFKKLGRALDVLEIVSPADRALIAQKLEFADDKLRPYPGKGRGVPAPFWLVPAEGADND